MHQNVDDVVKRIIVQHLGGMQNFQLATIFNS